MPTRAGSPQQHMPITVGPFYLTHPVNFPCGRKPEYPDKTHGFRQSVSLRFDSIRTCESATLEVKCKPATQASERKASAPTTSPPKPLPTMHHYFFSILISRTGYESVSSPHNLEAIKITGSGRDSRKIAQCLDILAHHVSLQTCSKEPETAPRN
jgi:hypothetical protein